VLHDTHAFLDPTTPVQHARGLALARALLARSPTPQQPAVLTVEERRTLLLAVAESDEPPGADALGLLAHACLGQPLHTRAHVHTRVVMPLLLHYGLAHPAASAAAAAAAVRAAPGAGEAQHGRNAGELKGGRLSGGAAGADAGSAHGWAQMRWLGTQHLHFNIFQYVVTQSR
jgi:hypothetical protein